MPNTSLKRAAHKIHLVLGLTIGLVFFVIALSGAIYTWEPEFSTLMYKQRVPAKNRPFVAVSTLKANLSEVFPEGDFRGVLYQGNERTANVLLYAPGTYYYAFMDPYSGKLLHLQDMKKGWLNQVKLLHRNLLLGDIGKEIVHWVTLLALFMLLTGLVLWWPKRMTKRKYLFTIQWKARRVKLNYDLHNVLGFYASWIALFSILTGIFWGFETFRDTLKIITGENEAVYEVPVSTSINLNEKPNLALIVDSLASAVQTKYSNRPIHISYPHEEIEPINVAVLDPGHKVFLTDIYYFDRFSGQQIEGNFEIDHHSRVSAYKTLNNLVYDIHLGTLGGFFGRVLVFFASLVMASLPITGFIIWLSKRKTD